MDHVKTNGGGRELQRLAVLEVLAAKAASKAKMARRKLAASAVAAQRKEEKTDVDTGATED